LWEPFDGKGCSDEVRGFYVDTVTNLLYVSGAFQYAGDSLVGGVAAWDGQTWQGFGPGFGDTLNMFGSAPILNVATIGNEIFAGGFMNFMAGDRDKARLSRWDGQQWNACGQPNSQIWLRQCGDHLFALGAFDEISGKEVHNVATWNGSEWDGFGHPSPLANTDFFTCAEYFRGKYYFGGNFSLPGNFNEILRWDGSNWEEVGGGVKGNGWLNDLKSFRDQLFVGGYFFNSGGNPSNHIMAWNGQSWYDPFPGVVYESQVDDLDIIDGELYITGNHQIWDGTQWLGPYNLARYDGENFCSFGGPYIWTKSITGYNGDIFVASGRVLNPFGDDSLFPNGRDTVNFLAKWLGGDSTDYCLYRPVQVQEESFQDLGISLFPNPANESFRLKLPATVPHCKLRILDLSGREILERPLYRGGEVGLESLDSGMYIVEARTDKGMQRIKLVRD
jgi:hypothetical protein